MLSKAQEDALAAKLEQERLNRIAAKEPKTKSRSPLLPGENVLDAEAADHAAARDGLNPNW